MQWLHRLQAFDLSTGMEFGIRIFTDVTIKVSFSVGVLFRLRDPPLPAEKDRQEMPQIKLGPQNIQEDNFGVLIALPEHEVTKTFHSRCSDQQIKWGVALGQHMIC